MKKLLLFGMVAFLLIGLSGFASGIAQPASGVAYYNFSDYTDLWGSVDGTNNGASSISNFVFFNTSGSSDPTSSRFDGTDDINFGNNFDYQNNEPFSFSIWANFSSLVANSELMVKRPSGGSFEGWQVRVESDGSVRFYAGRNTGAGAIQTSILSTNTVYNIIGTYDGSGNELGMTFYVNGIDDTNNRISAPIDSMINTVDFKIGTNGLQADLDEVKIFDKELLSKKYFGIRIR